MTRTEALTRTCAYCGARPGEPCTGAKGQDRAAMHLERHRPAVKLAPSGGKLARLGYDTYDEYLRSSHWKTIRRLYRAADLPQACPCGKRGTQLHHQHYLLLGEEWRDLSCLRPLCGDCHRFVHDLVKRPPDTVLGKGRRLRRRKI